MEVPSNEQTKKAGASGDAGAAGDNQKDGAGNGGVDMSRIEAMVASAVAKSMPGAVAAAMREVKRESRKERDGTRPAPGGENAGTDQADRDRKSEEGRRIAALERELGAMRKQSAENSRRAALASALRRTGVAFANADDAETIVRNQFDVNDDGDFVPRDAKHAGKPFDEVVRDLVAERRYLHAPTGRATGGPTGEADRPAGGPDKYVWNDKISSDENVRLEREWNAKRAK